ncbi:MAG: hypothetical protein Unbinned96contig1001_37 [Prokaryotic dsDNA virus sp.]|nr:MAG: hypothetical protein Unbinned96contig1001_37 [Prokaryotic dsDNA virus sp.]|tara:strand:- start:25505 stop:26728 length:1224 start_codon:yes stop_codon:yes gene_type:complete
MAVDAPRTTYKNPNCCASAFGRIFYAVDSLIYFSQVLVTAKDAGRCYQNNDPTSEEIPDLVDTDGGVITLEESVRIKALKPFSSGVLVFATNGVWYIYNPDGGFKATAFNLSKVSERGVESPRSIVEAEGAVFYFSNNAVMRISASEFDVLQSEDVSSPAIRGYFLANFSGESSQGVYDEASKQVVWWNPDSDSQGLIYDLEIGAFYPQKQSSTEWKMGRPFTIDNAVFYPAWKQDTENVQIEYGVSQRFNTSFQDFGANISAYMISGWETLGKFANSKSITQAKIFFKKTETEITGEVDGSYTFDSPSGCLFQSRWDYDSSDAFAKWTGINDFGGTGTIMQVYNPLQRGFIPNSYPYTFNTGESVISKKFSIRGSGDAVQFVFEAEDNKDMKLLGYSVNYTMRGRM